MKKLLLALLLLLGGVAHAQTPGEHLRVYLMTFGPGDAVWEKFGHNAIWIQDEQSNFGVAYNWGMFSFDEPGFVRRLVKGRMMYWMAGYEVNAMVDSYAKYNRSVWVQELNLTPQQRDSMRAFLEWNARDENKFYLYDPFRDNCSTRVRDAIDRITGGALQRTLKPVLTDETFRTHTQKLTFMERPLYTGLMLALGPFTDQPLTVWDEGFIPMELREAVRAAKVRAPDGSEQPLVVSERTLFEASGRDPLPAEAPDMKVWFTIAGCVIAALILLLGRLALRKRRLALALALALALWSLTVGVAGTLATLLWCCTDHVPTYSNENLLQANPLSLVLIVLGPAAVLGRIWVRRWAAWFALFIGGLSALGFLLQLLPGLDQVNGEIIGLMFPVHGAVASVLWQRWHVKLEDLTKHVTHQ